MARARKLRRRLRRKAPAVRRSGGDLMIGGAKDPAEGAADRLAAKALAGAAKSTGAAVGVPAVRRSAPNTTLAPGASSARAPKQAANLVTTLGAGRQLNAAERGYFEPRMGTDFSGVRVHEGQLADRATRALNAEAFAHGPDIAFASGKRDQQTMAHELAHVAQDGAPQVRRKIVTEVTDKKLSNLRHKLKKDYGVKGVTRTDNEYTYSAPITAGPINKQIASAMLASTRTFTLSGKHLYKAEASLRDHLKARRGVVDFSKQVRVDFGTGKDSFADDILKFVYDEAKTIRVQMIKDAEKKKGSKLTPSERTDMLVWSILRAFQKNANDKKLRDAIRTIQKKSSEYDKLKTKPKAKPFIAACFNTTAMVMFGGGGPISINVLSVKPGTQSKEGSTNWTDWVPGDWGYIASQAISPKAGLEGENIISVGNEKFWAHFGGIDKPQSLKALYDMVASWDKKAGKPILAPYRKFPNAGLK